MSSGRSELRARDDPGRQRGLQLDHDHLLEARGIAAYQKYEQDGQANDPIWRELRQQDEQAVRRLMQQLEQFAQQGKLQAQGVGGGGR